MSELDEPVPKLQCIRLDRSGEAALRAARGAQGRLDRRRHGPREGEARKHRLPSRRRKCRQPLRDKLTQAARDRQFGGGAGRLAAEGTEDLQREERVATRRSQEPRKGRPREGDAEALPDEMVKGAEGQRWDLERRALLLGAEPLEPERRLRPVAPSHEQSNPLVFQAPDDVGEDSRRGRVQPLDVVDRDQDRGRACEHPNRSERPNGSLPRLDGSIPARLAAKECDLERVPLRHRQGLEDRVVDARQQVDGGAEGKARLELGGTAGKDVVGVLLRRAEPRPPERRLADAERTL